jgi:hypothetical protein
MSISHKNQNTGRIILTMIILTSLGLAGNILSVPIGYSVNKEDV